MNELALFAGAGGGILGGKLLGWRTVCAVEIDPYARNVLLARQRDGMLEPFPIWDDVRTFDGTPWRGHVDVISGGFPCQDISAAGKGAGIDGERSGLWSEFARIIGEVRPQFVFVENSPLLTSRGLGRVLGDLATLGFDAEWGVLGANDAGAPHIRKRIWILANARCLHGDRGPHQPEGWGWIGNSSENVADPNSYEHEGQPYEGVRQGQISGAQILLPDSACNRHRQGRKVGDLRQEDGRSDGELFSESTEPGWWATEPALGRVANGVAHRVDRLRAIGNGQVPAVAALAWETLMRRVSEAV
jgi:DNA (cytosine-5)-methyltransferase 1